MNLTANLGQYAKKGAVPWNKGVAMWEGEKHPMLGRHISEEGKKRMSESAIRVGKGKWQKGIPKTEEHKQKISLSRIGRFKNENHPRWKGDEIGYQSLHVWVRLNLGKPRECVYCGENEKRIEWASIKRKANRDLSDYMPLCVLCHRQYDGKYSRFLLNFL